MSWGPRETKIWPSVKKLLSRSLDSSGTPNPEKVECGDKRQDKEQFEKQVFLAAGKDCPLSPKKALLPIDGQGQIHP